MNMNLLHLPDDVSAPKEIIHSQVASYRKIESKKSALESELTAATAVSPTTTIMCGQYVPDSDLLFEYLVI